MVNTLIADVSEINLALDKMDQIPSYVLKQIESEISGALREQLTSTFESAIEHQSEDAFPEEFAAHTLKVVSEAPIQARIDGLQVIVEFDFNELGSREQLERAFHQGARLKDGSILDGPYEGQELNNEDAADRHIVWLAIHKGQSSYPNPKGSGYIKLPNPNAWEETKQKYVKIWGNFAPEWLYLQFGQTQWDPQINSYPIIEEFTTRMEGVAEEIFNTRMTEAVEQAQGIGAVLTPYGARNIETGRFTSLRGG